MTYASEQKWSEERLRPMKRLTLPILFLIFSNQALSTENKQNEIPAIEECGAQFEAGTTTQSCLESRLGNIRSRVIYSCKISPYL